MTAETPESYVVTPGGSDLPPAYGDTPLPTPAGPEGQKKLVYVGVRNFVICQDMSDPKNIVEVWKHDMGSTRLLHSTQTYVASCGGVILAKYLTDLFGLNPDTGAELWKIPFPECGTSSYTSIVPLDTLAYVGCGNGVVAVSPMDGKILWQYTFDTLLGVLYPTIVDCGTAVFLVGSAGGVCLNSVDGTVRWKTKVDYSFRGQAPTGTWDGANRVFVGGMGYILRFDLRDGKELERINLKGTFYHNVKMACDTKRKQFYAATFTTLYAFSCDEDNHMLWKSVIPHPKGVFRSSFALEPESGRIFVFAKGRISCFDPTGKLLFDKGFDDSVFKTFYSVTQDVLGTGMLFMGNRGRFLVFDAEANLLVDDNLPGMGYNMTYLCTKTASIDPNSSGQENDRVVAAN